METLFPGMLQALATAATTITHYKGRLQDDSKYDEYTDAADIVIEKLKEFHSVVKMQYSFSEGLPGDIINCARILSDNNVALTEEVDYQFNRNLLYGGNSYDKTNTRFLEEVITTITHECDKISELLGAAVAV